MEKLSKKQLKEELSFIIDEVMSTYDLEDAPTFSTLEDPIIETLKSAYPDITDEWLSEHWEEIEDICYEILIEKGEELENEGYELRWNPDAKNSWYESLFEIVAYPNERDLKRKELFYFLKNPQKLNINPFEIPQIDLKTDGEEIWLDSEKGRSSRLIGFLPNLKIEKEHLILLSGSVNNKDTHWDIRQRFLVYPDENATFKNIPIQISEDKIDINTTAFLCKEGTYILEKEEESKLFTSDKDEPSLKTKESLKLLIKVKDNKVKFELLEWNYQEEDIINNDKTIKYNKEKNEHTYMIIREGIPLPLGDEEENKEAILEKFEDLYPSLDKEYTIEEANSEILLSLYPTVPKDRLSQIIKEKENVKININQNKKANDNDLDNR